MRASSRTGSWTVSGTRPRGGRSEEHTSELQSQSNLVCRLLLEKKKMLSFDRRNRQRGEMHSCLAPRTRIRLTRNPPCTVSVFHSAPPEYLSSATVGIRSLALFH